MLIVKMIAMKKLLLFGVATLLFAFVFVSCQKEEETFDQTLLYGTWNSGTEYYKYSSDGTGGTWDTADDMTEADAQAFTWSLDAADLTQIHILEMGGTVTKIYTVTELTATTLKYKDEYDSYTFTKVN